MDAAIYSLIGVVAGVSVTQVSSYFLESMKSKRELELKKLDLDSTQKSVDKQLKREAFSDFFKDVDLMRLSKEVTINELTVSFYKAIILADKDCQKLMVKIYNICLSDLKGEEIDVDDFLKTKGSLLKLIHEDLA